MAKEVGGLPKRWKDGKSGLRMGQDVGQGMGGWAKGRGVGNEMDGMGQAPGLPGGVLGHGQRVAILRGPRLFPDVPRMKKRMRPHPGTSLGWPRGCPWDVPRTSWKPWAAPPKNILLGPSHIVVVLHLRGLY